MTNAEKFLKVETNIDEFTFKFDDWHFKNSDVIGYGEALFRFLQAEEKPTLTEDERVILRNIKEYKFIGRGKNKRIIAGELYISKYSSKDYDFDDTEWIFFEPYEHLFRWINSGEEYSIEELLKGE